MLLLCSETRWCKSGKVNPSMPSLSQKCKALFTSARAAEALIGVAELALDQEAETPTEFYQQKANLNLRGSYLRNEFL